jgi:hypothetical protein
MPLNYCRNTAELLNAGYGGNVIDDQKGKRITFELRRMKYPILKPGIIFWHAVFL